MTAKKLFLKSNFDEIIFEANEKVINSSILLKNLFDIVLDTSDPISIDCTANSLKIFVEFIKIREENITDDEKRIELEAELFKDFIDDTTLTDFIKDVCIFDCDILLDALADIILDKLKDMTNAEINEYLQIENDFTTAEMEWQSKKKLEYFISLNDASFPLQFPIPCQNFYSIKTKFSSPLNILLAKICQRSEPNVSFRLGQCCKALKNECDRQPIKVALTIHYLSWHLTIEKENKWSISVEEGNEKYFSAIKKRRVLAWNDDIKAWYFHNSFSEVKTEILKTYSSLEWVIPHKNVTTVEVMFSNFEIFIANFDVKKFPFSHICFDLKFSNGIDFDFVYNNLIAKDLSKEVELRCSHINIQQGSAFRFYKKSNATKFFRCLCVKFPKSKEDVQPELKHFLMKYMEYDGHFEFIGKNSIIPEHIIRIINFKEAYKLPIKYCVVSDILKYL